MQRHVFRRGLPVTFELNLSPISSLVDQLLEQGPIGCRDLRLSISGWDDPMPRLGEEKLCGVTGCMVFEARSEYARSALEHHENLRAVDIADHIYAFGIREEEVVISVVARHGDIAAHFCEVVVIGNIDAATGERGQVLGDLQLRSFAEQAQLRVCVS